MKKLWKRLYALKRDMEFVQGKGKRKSPLQKAIEAVEGYLARQKQYDDYNHSFGNRNSFSKTDRDATFRRPHEKRSVEASLQRHPSG